MNKNDEILCKLLNIEDTMNEIYKEVLSIRKENKEFTKNIKI